MFEILDLFGRKCFFIFFLGCMVGERDWCMKWGLLNACCYNARLAKKKLTAKQLNRKRGFR